MCLGGASPQHGMGRGTETRIAKAAGAFFAQKLSAYESPRLEQPRSAVGENRLSN